MCLEHSPLQHPTAPGAHSSIPRASQAQLAPGEMLIHPGTFTLWSRPGRQPGGSWVGVSNPWPASRPHLVTENEAAAASSIEPGADCPAVCSCGEAVLPPARNCQGLCLHQCSCEVSQMQPSCSKPKWAPNSVNQTVLLHLQSHPVKCPRVTKQNEAVWCRAHTVTLLQWLVDISYCASMEKELSQPLARPWRGSLTFTEGKVTKLENICLIFTNSHMRKISKKN